MDFTEYDFTVKERFLRYVKIDTQSDPSSLTCPSTLKQKDLGRLLLSELNLMGLQEVEMDENGYVYASLPSNTTKNVPVICFCSHMDTSPDCSGKNVNPIVHESYSGNDLILPKDTSQVIRFTEHPDLKDQLGNDIITADGTTLLGADNKAGIAEIMDAMHYLLSHPEIKHGKIRVLFTPDEEIGRGVDNVDMKKLGAEFGYTIDGESRGTIENETFSADSVTLIINGFPTHPGFANNKLQHAMKIASEIISNLPPEIAPEHTEAKEPFIHPVAIQGGLERVELKFIIRAFETIKLQELETYLEDVVKSVLKKYKRCSYEFIVSEQYRNMKEVLDNYPFVAENAVEAIRRAGMEPRLSSIRGGTDGSRLSFMGLPCPNIFAGEHAFHSRQEWVSVQDMEKSVETIVRLCAIWEERA